MPHPYSTLGQGEKKKKKKNERRKEIKKTTKVESALIHLTYKQGSWTRPPGGAQHTQGLRMGGAVSMSLISRVAGSEAGDIDGLCEDAARCECTERSTRMRRGTQHPMRTLSRLSRTHVHAPGSLF